MTHLDGRSSPPPPSRGAALRSLLRCALVVAVLVSGSVLLGTPGAARAEGPRWQWPLTPRPAVVRAFDPPAHEYGAGHRGVDLAAEPGAIVRAVEDGTVRFTGTVAGRPVVSLVHADGLISTYEPVTGTLAQGQGVRAGEPLGEIAAVAAAPHCQEGSCLNLGARTVPGYLDPLLLLGARGPTVLRPWDGPGGDPGVGGPRARLA